MRINVHLAEERQQQQQQAPLLMAVLSSGTARLAGLMSLTIGWADEYAVRVRASLPCGCGAC